MNRIYEFVTYKIKIKQRNVLQVFLWLQLYLHRSTGSPFWSLMFRELLCYLYCDVCCPLGQIHLKKIIHFNFNETFYPDLKKKIKWKSICLKKKLTAASSLWQKRSLKLMINWYHSWAICHIDIFLTDYRQKVIHNHLNSSKLFSFFFGTPEITFWYNVGKDSVLSKRVSSSGGGSRLAGLSATAVFSYAAESVFSLFTR